LQLQCTAHEDEDGGVGVVLCIGNWQLGLVAFLQYGIVVLAETCHSPSPKQQGQAARSADCRSQVEASQSKAAIFIPIPVSCMAVLK
jgi:hypothetical protein